MSLFTEIPGEFDDTIVDVGTLVLALELPVTLGEVWGPLTPSNCFFSSFSTSFFAASCLIYSSWSVEFSVVTLDSPKIRRLKLGLIEI